MEQSTSKKRILDAAKAIYVEKGYEGTSMNAIALAVGMRKASLYAHFASKEALFKAMMTEIMEKHIGAVQGIFASLEGQSGKSALFRLITRYVAYCYKSQDMDVWTRSYYFPPMALKAWLQGSTHSIEKAIRKKMVDIIKIVQAENEDNPYSPVQVMNVFYHFMLGYVLSYTEYEYDPVEEELKFGFEKIWQAFGLENKRSND